MRKFLSYMFAGVLVSSLSVLACSSDSTRDVDGDEEESSSSSGGSSGKATSSSGGTNTSSSGGTSSSSGSTNTFDVEVSDFAITPATGTVGVEATHTFTMKFTGTIEEGAKIIIGAKTVPTGVTNDNLGVTDLNIASDSPEGTIGGTFKFKPSTAGAYAFIGGVDGDGDQATEDDLAIANDATVTIAAAE